MSTILELLASILLLICAPSQVCGVYPDNYNPILYEAFHEALINDTNNLIQLQSAFYPSGGDDPISVYISFETINVNNIMAQNDPDPAFRNCSSGYCLLYDYGYMISRDTSSSSHERLKQYIINKQDISVVVIAYTSFIFFSKLTFSNLDLELQDDTMETLFN